MTGYYPKFINNYSDKTKALTKLLHKNTNFNSWILQQSFSIEQFCTVRGFSRMVPTTCHTATETMKLLRKKSQNSPDLIWLSHSLDLCVTIFFLWGYLKSKMFTDKLWDVAGLQTNIERQIAIIPVIMREKVIENLVKLLENRVKNKDGHCHLDDVIFKT